MTFENCALLSGCKCNLHVLAKQLLTRTLSSSVFLVKIHRDSIAAEKISPHAFKSPRPQSMSFSSAMRGGIIVAVLVLLNASLHLADRRPKPKGSVDQVTSKRLPPRKPRPTSSPMNHVAQCDGESVPILPPSFTYPGSLWSVRALMFLQILPDGTVNGTLESANHYARLNIQIVSENGCMVRIRGEASQLYLVMGVNGTLSAQSQPHPTRSIFTVQLQRIFFTFKNGDYFIALKQGGGIKKIKQDENGRSHRRSTRFVLLPRPVRKRRFPADFGLKQTTSNNLRLKLFGNLHRRRHDK